MRASGILMPLSSLPSDYGIGTMGKAAYDFIDFLEKAGQKLWQMLPVNPTSFGDSPYQSFSTFAGNPYFIDLELLCIDGLLKKEDYADLEWGPDEEKVDYSRIFALRFPVLKKAYNTFVKAPPKQFAEFEEKNGSWLEDYAIYMALKKAHWDHSWTEWEEPLRQREPKAMARWKKDLEKEIGFWKFIQYEFDVQWKRLKEYANEKGVKLIGDIPIYVALDSADVWANPDMFLLDEKLQPVVVAGCPPDYFSATGQLWGNPIYHWEAIRDDGYRWWVARIEAALNRYDMVRIDHFRGFESFWAIPAGDETAENGEWRKGPGMELFDCVNARLGGASIIAEDLGLITDPVRELLKESGYPGMKVLQFAFNAGENSDYLPHNYGKNCICYTGTHDNDTLAGWFDTLSKADREYVMEYTRSQTEDECLWNLIALAWASTAEIAITQMQDFLGLGSEARMNTPSTPSGNWVWRMEKGALTSELAERIAALTKLYWR